MSRYQSWSLPELRGAVAAAHEQLSWLDAIHDGFAQSSHQLAALGDSIGLARNAVAANWGGTAGAAAAQSASNLQAFSRAAHDASYQSATATRELGHATRNHSSRMHEIKTVDTSFHKSLAASGGNPAAATADHHRRVQAAEQNRVAAVRQAEALDAKGHEYNTMMKNTRWPTMTSQGSTAPPPVNPPTLPPTPPPTRPNPVRPTPITTDPTGPVTPPPLVRGKHPGDNGTDLGSGGGTVTAGIDGGAGAGQGGAGLGGSGFGGSGSGGTGLGGSGLGGAGGHGDALAGGLTGGLTRGLTGELAGAPGGPRGAAATNGLADEARGGPRGGAAAPAEEGRGGMYGPGGGARRNDGDEEKRRPDYLEEDEDPWGLGIANAVPAVIGEED